MKKLLPVLLMLAIISFVNVTSRAQSPRLQLLEYFDNTSIPSFGAVANAHCDSLMSANTNKIVCLKYHVYWGSQNYTDPMNLQDSAQSLARANYYNLLVDPTAIQDGSDTAANRFIGQPSNFTQADINRRDSVSSPFTISVSHSLNTADDSIYTHTVITKTDTASGALVAQVVVIENLIQFAIPPGESGDTIFRNVMKQMLPTSAGTVLPNMNIGDSVVLNLKWKLANVYNQNELAVISFVQNNGTKEVLQAGYSESSAATGITGIEAKNEMNVFPNPARGNVLIHLGSHINNGTIKLFSVTGNNVTQMNNLNGTDFPLDISKQPKGIYFINVSDGQKQFNQKLVIQ